MYIQYFANYTDQATIAYHAKKMQKSKIGYAHRYFFLYETRSLITITQEITDHTKPIRTNITQTTEGALPEIKQTTKPSKVRGSIQYPITLID